MISACMRRKDYMTKTDTNLHCQILMAEASPKLHEVAEHLGNFEIAQGSSFA